LKVLSAGGYGDAGSMKLKPSEFERLAVEQMDTVYRVARRLARDAGRAEDLVQETYLRAFRSRESFKLEEFGIRPWLLRILYNLHLSRGQREGRQPVAMDEGQLQAAEGKGAADDVLPLDPKSWEGMDERLVRAIDALPVEYSAPLVMWAVEDLSYKEIALALDVPIGTVMSRLHRARQKLTEALHDLAVEERIIRE
jgi:RNA polymerase sigma-70 factor, ECF subfamily